MKSAWFSPQAQRDLEEIVNYISGDNPDAAERVRENILNTADLLAQHPKMGRLIRNALPRHADIRWSIVPRFRNYLVFYKAHQETIMVVRVLHAARDWTRFFPTADKPAD